jgi:glycerate kinase
VLVAPDAFKGSLSAPAAAAAMARGVLSADPGAAVRELPMADGGEGTLDCLCAAAGRRHWMTVQDPLGRPVRASWGEYRRGGLRSAVVELAAASGLQLLDRAERDPLRASSFGTGQLLAAALASAPDRLIVALGGSATVDGGAGILGALGFRLLDAAGEPLPPGGEALLRLERIDPPEEGRAVPEIWLACDVVSPLLGPQGALLYAAQKGAGGRERRQLGGALRRFAEVALASFGRGDPQAPYGGAAGGAAFGLAAALGARAVSGADLVAEALGLAEAVSASDLVLTGEGQLDIQTAQGKVVSRVAGLGARAGKPVVAIAGSLSGGGAVWRASGVTAAISLARGPLSLAAARRSAVPLLELAAEQVVRIFSAGRCSTSA